MVPAEKQTFQVLIQFVFGQNALNGSKLGEGKWNVSCWWKSGFESILRMFVNSASSPTLNTVGMLEIQPPPSRQYLKRQQLKVNFGSGRNL